MSYRLVKVRYGLPYHEFVALETPFAEVFDFEEEVQSNPPKYNLTLEDAVARARKANNLILNKLGFNEVKGFWQVASINPASNKEIIHLDIVGGDYGLTADAYKFNTNPRGRILAYREAMRSYANRPKTNEWALPTPQERLSRSIQTYRYREYYNALKYVFKYSDLIKVAARWNEWLAAQGLDDEMIEGDAHQSYEHDKEQHCMQADNIGELIDIINGYQKNLGIGGLVVNDFIEQLKDAQAFLTKM